MQTVSEFQVVSDYEPAGDQPAAIRGLVEGLESGLAHQTLLGVTGSGKDLRDRQGDRDRAAADHRDGAEQDPGCTALR